MRSDLLIQFIGLTLQEAQELANEESYLVRVVQKDGVRPIFTLEQRHDRINVTIVEDIIVKAYIG